MLFFHFGQANWRNIVSLGFCQRYIEDLDFALKVRMVTALAFMPADERSGTQFHLSSVNIKTLNIRIGIKTTDFISVTIETKRRHDTCTCICVY